MISIESELFYYAQSATQTGIKLHHMYSMYFIYGFLTDNFY